VVTTENPLPALIRSLHERIATDFGFSNRPPSERAEILERLSSMVLGGALMRAGDLLGEEESQYVEEILKEGGETDPKKVFTVANYIASRVPNLGTLIDEAYEEVKALALQVTEKAREEKFEHADETAEAAGDLLELVEDGTEAAGVEVPGLSAVGVGVDLLFDPARFRRSAEERQRRFFKNAAVLCGKALAAVWSGLLLFTIYEALHRHNLIAALPKLIREAVPDWYERQSIGGQMSLLVASAAGLILVAVIVVYLAARAGSSPRLTSAFELKVNDDELASTAMRPLLLPSVYPSGVPKDILWRACKGVYKSVYLNSGKANSDDLKLLEEILNGGNEKAVVAFLKSKVRGYRSAMQREVKDYCTNAAEVMGQIK